MKSTTPSPRYMQSLVSFLVPSPASSGERVRVRGRIAHMRPIILLTLIAPLVALAQEPMPLYTAFTALPTFALGQDPAPLNTLHDAVIESQLQSAEERAELAVNLAMVLSQADATFDAKLFACRMLMLIGSEAQVPALSPLLSSEEFSDIARYAVEKIPGTKAEIALLDALAIAPPKVQVGLLGSLGARGSIGSIQTIRFLAMATESTEVLVAAADSLAALAPLDATAISALGAISSKREREDTELIIDALLRAGDARLAGGDAKGAAIIYRALYRGERTEATKRAAFEGWMKAQPEKVAEYLPEMLTGNDERAARQALHWVSQAGAGDTATFVKTLDTLPAHRVPALLVALGGRGDTAALQAVHDRLNAPDAAVADAALAAVAELGDTSSVAPLLALAAGADDKRRVAVLSALAGLNGEEVDAALATQAGSADAALKPLVAEALGARGNVAAVPMLLDWAGGDDETAAVAAVKAVGRAGGMEQVEALANLMRTGKTDALRNEAASALGAMLRRQPDEVTRSVPVTTMLASEANAAVRAAFIKILGSMGDVAALPSMQSALTDADASVRLAAIEELTNWHTGAPRDSLLDVAKNATADQAERDLALAGYIALCRKETTLPPAERVALFDEALAVTQDVKLLGAVISGLGEIPDRSALALVQEYIETDGLKREARVAADSIRSLFYTATASHNQDDAAEALDGKIETRWTTGALQAPGMRFDVDLTESVKLGGIILDNSRSKLDSPAGYKVYVYNDPASMGDPVAEGKGDEAVLNIRFDSAEGRYVSIEQTGESGSQFWSIDEFRILTR